jgi:branched-chain amino acid transport system ATP-binding protein
VVVRRIYGLLPQLLSSGVTVLLVEQDVSQALAVASVVHCLLEGRITLEGDPAGMTPAQIEGAYFGVSGGRTRNGTGNGTGTGNGATRAAPAPSDLPGADS